MSSHRGGRFPLFKGATRLPTYLGVPRTVFLGTFMLSASLFLTIHFWAFALFAFLIFVEYCLAKHDDRIFRIAGLAIRTKLLSMVDSPLTKRWKGSSESPVDYRSK